ncbi:glutaredoxin 3 [Thiomicrospira microaerophila]|uniref:glutaredoxin 3 n=1 Tax=Thiomicrospira microaerophila TaxID=406020 RepID=UPI00200D3E1A|nr:glutaredoxin 3 [Thiomicrospira microaerophila]UQB42541.1 glutaredoxin 3 [Thiomicrospira microaerophila]
MAEIIVYLNKTCPYCTRAKSLLDRRGLAFQAIDVTGSDALWREMEQRSGRSTIPQVFINNTHVGGFDELNAADKSGKLDKLLNS